MGVDVRAATEADLPEVATVHRASISECCGSVYKPDQIAEWISLLIGLIIFVLSSIQALVEVGFVLLRVAPGFIPPYLWLIPASGVAGLSLLWAVSIWRLTRAAQGA